MPLPKGHRSRPEWQRRRTVSPARFNHHPVHQPDGRPVRLAASRTRACSAPARSRLSRIIHFSGVRWDRQSFAASRSKRSSRDCGRPCCALQTATFRTPSASPDEVLGLFCALAEQCFLNEYIFAQTARGNEPGRAIARSLAAQAARWGRCSGGPLRRCRLLFPAPRASKRGIATRLEMAALRRRLAAPANQGAAGRD